MSLVQTRIHPHVWQRKTHAEACSAVQTIGRGSRDCPTLSRHASLRQKTSRRVTAYSSMNDRSRGSRSCKASSRRSRSQGASGLTTCSPIASQFGASSGTPGVSIARK